MVEYIQREEHETYVLVANLTFISGVRYQSMVKHSATRSIETYENYPCLPCNTFIPL